MTSATFENGTTTVYGGKRDVTSAWLIVDRKTGEAVESWGKVAKGFSVSGEAAHTTATGKVRDICHQDFIFMTSYDWNHGSPASKHLAGQFGTTNTTILKRKVREFNVLALNAALSKYQILIVAAS
jgi:hypothetical protein